MDDQNEYKMEVEQPEIKRKPLNGLNRNICVTIDQIQEFVPRKEGESDFRYKQRLFREAEKTRTFEATGRSRPLVVQKR